MINKKILGVIALGTSVVSLNTYAAAQGPYVGAQAGYGNVHQAGTDVNLPYFTEKDTAKNIAGRVFGGYQFTPNLAAELGWSRYGNVEAKGQILGSPYSATLKTNVVDLVVKGIYPVADQVSLFGKIGGAYVIQDVENPINNYNEVMTYTQKKLLPTASVGVSYAFTDNVSADVSYTRIQKVGHATFINSIDSAGVGLTFSFG